ncbi:MAG: hypothetical protein IJA23_01395 [Clostridia bacterium]|nr:hypothetical protein [Clostridia bacterium]
MAYRNEASWGKRNLDKVNHWQRLNLDKYVPDKPVIVCIGGNGTVVENSANGVCKFVENYLQLLFKQGAMNKVYDYVDIIGAVYPTTDNPAKGKFEKEDIDNFVDKFLIKMLQDENDELVPLNEACRRLSQVTFFTFCRGHLEVDKIMRAFYKELKVLGYSREECDILMQTTFEVSFAPLTFSSVIPALFVDTKQDEMLNSAWKNNETNVRLDDGLNGVAVKYEKYGDPLLSGVATSEAIFDAIHIYSSKLRNNIQGDEHSLAILGRDGSWNAKYEPNADCVSQMIAWALSRSVDNGLDNKKSKKFVPKMPLEELMAELEGIKNDFSAEQLMSRE